MKKYLILLSFILFLIVLYLLIKYYKKQNLINNIIKEWKTQTNGNVFKDTGGSIWKNDYYLMFNNSNDYSSHVHLKVFNNDFWFFTNCFKILQAEYTPKKNNNYPLGFADDNTEFVKEYAIDESISPNKIVKQMIETYTNF